jgi:hypothetical protein
MTASVVWRVCGAIICQQSDPTFRSWHDLLMRIVKTLVICQTAKVLRVSYIDGQ